jgi:hypothetical protein
MAFVFYLDGDTQPLVFILRRPLWLTEKPPTHNGSVYVNGPFYRSFAPFFLSMHLRTIRFASGRLVLVCQIQTETLLKDKKGYDRVLHFSPPQSQ